MKPEHALHTVNIVRVNDSKFNAPYVYRTVLPSNGYLYGGRFPGGEVLVKPMTASEEGLLASNKSDKGSIVDVLCRRCLVECPVPYDELLVSDIFYLLLVIRNISYGSDYRFTIQCSNCGTKYSRAIQIPEGLRVLALTEADDCEPYEVRLPISKDVLAFRLLRHRDEESIRRYAKNRYVKTVEEGDPSYCIRLSTHIESVNGQVLDAVQKLSYVEHMIAADVCAFKDELELRDFGASLILDSECPACGYAAEQLLPFDRTFFRPERAVS